MRFFQFRDSLWGMPNLKRKRKWKHTHRSITFSYCCVLCQKSAKHFKVKPIKISPQHTDLGTNYVICNQLVLYLERERKQCSTTALFCLILETQPSLLRHVSPLGKNSSLFQLVNQVGDKKEGLYSEPRTFIIVGTVLVPLWSTARFWEIVVWLKGIQYIWNIYWVYQMKSFGPRK